MQAIHRLVAIGSLALSISPLPANAGSPVTTISPFYPPIYGAPNQPAPYWATPYWATPGTLSVTPGTTFYPSNSPNLPQQYANPALNRFPPGAQTCSAPPYTCPASAPNTPGNACTCPTEDGSTIEGTVH